MRLINQRGYNNTIYNKAEQLNEETLKERMIEEYITIMDSLDLQEKARDEPLLLEPSKDNQTFLQHLDELCSDTDFIRTAGSHLDMDFWDSMDLDLDLDLDLDPVDRVALDQQQHQEDSQTKNSSAAPPIDDAPSVLPDSSNCDQNDLPPDDEQVVERIRREIEDAIAAIQRENTAQAQVDEENTFALLPSSPDDFCAASKWEIVDWPFSNDDPISFIPLGAFPAGSPLLPTDVLELIQATPITTSGAPFDESIYLDLHSPKDSTTSLSSDSLAETWLRDARDDKSPCLEIEKPNPGRRSLLSLSDLALLVFLDSEQLDRPVTHKSDGNLPDLLKGDVVTFASPVQGGSGVSSAALESDVGERKICRNLEMEMAALQISTPKREAPRQKVQKNGELQEQQQSAASEIKQEIKRSQRLSSQRQKISAETGSASLASDKTPTKQPHRRCGDFEVNATKTNAKSQTPNHSLLSLSDLALLVFLDSEQLDRPVTHKSDGNLPDLLKGDVVTFASPVQGGSSVSSAALESDVAERKICRNLETEMAALQISTPKREAPRQKVQKNGELQERQQSAASEIKQEIKRSQRLSSQRQKISAETGSASLASDKTPTKQSHRRCGDFEVNATKTNGARRQSCRGRSEERKAKTGNKDVERRRTRSMTMTTGWNVRMARCRSSDAPKSPNTSKRDRNVGVVSDLNREKSNNPSPAKRGRRHDVCDEKVFPKSPKKKTRQSNSSAFEDDGDKNQRNVVGEEDNRKGKLRAANDETVGAVCRTRSDVRKRTRFAKLPAKYKDFVTCKPRTARQTRWQQPTRSQRKKV